MKTVPVDIASSMYDPAPNVMYFSLSFSRFADEEEVAPDIHVLYAYEGERLDKIVAI